MRKSQYFHQKYSRQSRSIKINSFKPFIYGGIFLVVLAGICYLLFFSGYFRIKEIKVEGNKTILAQEISKSVNLLTQGKIFYVISKNNVFLVSKEKIKDELLNAFPKIDSLEVKKRFPSKLIIAVRERVFIGIYCNIEADQSLIEYAEEDAESVSVDQRTVQRVSASTSDNTENPFGRIDNCFYIDKHGIIFEEAPMVFGSLILLISDLRETEVKLGDSAVKSNLIKLLINLKEIMPEKTGVKITEFDISNIKNKELEALTNEKWKIYFNTETTAEKQIEILTGVLEKKIKEKRENLEYVDLRLGNRVYYKLLE